MVSLISLLPRDCLPLLQLASQKTAGGGYWVCPGRYFGKMEIMLALALIVTKFDLEFLQWKHLDGAESDWPARIDSRYVGSITMFPDRDISVRWRKI